jgi:hypothetical protein
MSDTIVSQSATWDSKLGGFVTTTTIESLAGFPSIPSGAVDATKTIQDGVYRVTYKDFGDTTSGGGGGGSSGGSTVSYNYEAHSSVSTEPLITFGNFGAGGVWHLDDTAKDKIKKAEADPTLWKQYAAGTDGLAVYASFILSGIETFFAPTITLTITADEESLPDLGYLGKIATVSNAPILPNGGTWLFAGCNFSALQNGKWRVSREYRASGKGGWNEDLYGNGGNA